MTSSKDVYEVRPRKDKRGVDLISDALPFGRLWYEDASAAVDYAKHSSRSHDAVTRVYDAAGNVIETQEQAGHFRNLLSFDNRAGFDEDSRAALEKVISKIFRNLESPIP